MRIAVCLSGQPREIPACSESLTKILLRDQEVDYFVHFWAGSSNQVEYRSFWHHRRAHPFDSDSRFLRRLRRQWWAYRNYRSWVASRDFVFPTDPAEIHALVEEAYAPTRIVVEPQLEFDTSDFDRSEQNVCFADGETTPKNALSMFHSIRRANDLKREHEAARGFRYDCVIRCRSDLRFSGPLPKAALDALGEGLVVLPTHDHFRGANDQFALGRSATLDIYADTFNSIRSYYASGGLFNPEAILLGHLSSSAVKVVTRPIAYELFRGTAAAR
jgi:hypothetical protein